MKIMLRIVLESIRLFALVCLPVTVFLSLCIGIFVAFMFLHIFQLDGALLWLLILYIIVEVAFTYFHACIIYKYFDSKKIPVQRCIVALSGLSFYILCYYFCGLLSSFQLFLDKFVVINTISFSYLLLLWLLVDALRSEQILPSNMKIMLRIVLESVRLFVLVCLPAVVFLSLCIGTFIAFIMLLSLLPFYTGMVIWPSLLIFYIIVEVAVAYFHARIIYKYFGSKKILVQRCVVTLSGLSFYILCYLFWRILFLIVHTYLCVVLGHISFSYLLLLWLFWRRFAKKLNP